MAVISAFADEIAPDLKTQMDVCEAHGVRCIDVRAIDGINVSKLTVEQVAGYKSQMDDRGFSVPCIGSPIGKIRIDEPFGPHLELLKHCGEVAHAFGSERIRLFSFYGPEGGNIADHRDEVMSRMAAMAAVGERTGVTMMHENEADIYGARRAGVIDLFETIRSDRFEGIFDPGNYVTENEAPYDDVWTKGVAELTHYFHIKDKTPGAPACVPAGEGDGQIPEILADAKRRGFDGIMT
ncbi:MAG TPA: TIM barrel protein, partial [Phycisphaerae bacterium]|nr:TIM barrel protein [Phycisphaerae bacterium]